jgi:hypothetical protein
MERDQELDTLYSARQTAITQIAVTKDIQAALAVLQAMQMVGNDVVLTALDTTNAMIIDLVTVMVAIENRINTITAHTVKETIK